MEAVEWTDVHSLDDLEHEVLTSANTRERSLVLYRVGDEVRAFHGKCPHKKAPMGQGVACRAKKGEVVLVCPWHRAIFSAKNGQLIEPPALESLDQYPVEIREGRILVGAEPLKRQSPKALKPQETVIIAGGGAAATAAVVTLREKGFAGRIAMISPENEVPYDRTALSKTMLSKAKEGGAPPALMDESWYEKNRIELVSDTVTKIDFKKLRVSTNLAGDLSADYLILATGSKARQPSLPGSELKGVHVLRRAEDLRGILSELQERMSAVIIGSGFIGMEAAAALRKRGVGVAVISRSGYPMEKQFGREISQAIRALHESKGVAFVHDVEVERLIGEERVETVELQDGTKIGADIVIFGIGAEPSLDYLQDGQKNREPGLNVDAQMCHLPNVYVVGDLARVTYRGKRYRIEHWRTAQCQARIAATALLGLPTEPLSMPWFWTQQYDRKLEYLGWPKSFDRVEIKGDLSRFEFVAEVIKGKKKVGIIASGHPKMMSEAAITFDEA